MKSALIPLLVALAPFGWLTASAGAQHFPELAGFALSMTPIPHGVSVTCAVGCDWRRLSAVCDEGKPCITVDSFGVSGAHPLQPPAFAVSIRRVARGLALHCERGCSWTTRSIDCGSGGSCVGQINEYGVSVSPSKAPVVPRKRPRAPADFGGRWVLASGVEPPRHVPYAMDVQQSGGRDLFEVRVERHFNSSRRVDTYVVGVVGGSSSMSGEHTTFECRWEGKTLVIKSDHYTGRTRDDGPYTERVEVWALDGPGKLRVCVRQRESGVEAKPMTFVYRRM